MKRILLLLAAVFALLSIPALAQTNVHPTQISYVYEDSANGASPTVVMWTLGATLDADTSIAFSVYRMPETGLGIQVYWNDSDTGQICFILQQNSFLSTAGGFADSAAAVDYISSWVFADSVSVGDASGRGGFCWNPTLIGPTDKARIIAVRRSGTDPREFAILRTRQD